MDSKHFVAIPFLLLKTIGLHNTNTVNLQYKYNLKISGLFVLTMIYLSCAFFSFIYYLCTVQRYNSEYIDILNILLSLGYMTLAIGKIATLLLKRRKIKRIMQDLDQIFPRTTQTFQHMNVKSYLGECTKIAKWLAIGELSIIWIYNITPIAESFVKFFIWPGNRIWTFRLPFTTLPFFPYNYDHPVYNIIHYAIQSWIGYMETNLILSLDLLLIGLVSQIRMHFEYLNATLERMKFNADDPRNIRICIEKHCKLNRYVSLRILEHNFIISEVYSIILNSLYSFRLSDELNDIFSITILFNFMSSSVVICILAFMATIMTSYAELCRYLFASVESIIQVFIICLFSDKLTASVWHWTYYLWYLCNL